MAWFLAYRAGMEATGVYTAILVAEIMVTVAGILMFRRGRWKEQEI